MIRLGDCAGEEWTFWQLIRELSVVIVGGSYLSECVRKLFRRKVGLKVTPKLKRRWTGQRSIIDQEM